MGTYDSLFESSDEQYFICKVCGTQLAKSGGQANCKRHLIRHHPDRLALIDAMRKTPLKPRRAPIKKVKTPKQELVSFAGTEDEADITVGRVNMTGYIVLTAGDLCRFCVAWREGMRPLDDEEKRWLGPDDAWLACPICPRCANKIRRYRFEEYFSRANESADLLGEMHRRFGNASLPIDIQSNTMQNEDYHIEEEEIIE